MDFRNKTLSYFKVNRKKSTNNSVLLILNGPSKFPAGEGTATLSLFSKLHLTYLQLPYLEIGEPPTQIALHSYFKSTCYVVLNSFVVCQILLKNGINSVFQVQPYFSLLMSITVVPFVTGKSFSSF